MNVEPANELGRIAVISSSIGAKYITLGSDPDLFFLERLEWHLSWDPYFLNDGNDELHFYINA